MQGAVDLIKDRLQSTKDIDSMHSMSVHWTQSRPGKLSSATHHTETTCNGNGNNNNNNDDDDVQAVKLKQDGAKRKFQRLWERLSRQGKVPAKSNAI